jgi:hypothetical protein
MNTVLKWIVSLQAVLVAVAGVLTAVGTVDVGALYATIVAAVVAAFGGAVGVKRAAKKAA